MQLIVSRAFHPNVSRTSEWADLSNLQMNIEVRYKRRVTRAHTENKAVAKVDMKMAN